MAYDDRQPRRGYGVDRQGMGDRWRDRDSAWRRDDVRGGRPQRLGDRSYAPSDDPYADSERYGGGEPGGYGADYRGGGSIGSGGPGFGSGIGYDGEFSGPRFDRADVGSTGTHGVHPVSSSSSPAYGFAGGYGSTARAYAIRQQARDQSHDPHYSEWRQRQIDALDRDYDDYRRENQTRFDSEFGTWRQRRGEQRQAVGKVTEHMEVVGSDGSHVGTVDKVKGDQIVLTKNDASAGGLHHSIPCGWVDSVDDKVKLNLTADQAQERWQTDHRSRALFEREDSGSSGPGILNRSFAGTYDDDNRRNRWRDED